MGIPWWLVLTGIGAGAAVVIASKTPVREGFVEVARTTDEPRANVWVARLRAERIPASVDAVNGEYVLRVPPGAEGRVLEIIG